MTNVDPKSSRLRFTLYGPIRIWDLAERRLNLGRRDLWLAPGVPTTDLELGTEIVAKDYQAAAGERWVVDLITITSVDVSRQRPRSLRSTRSRS